MIPLVSTENPQLQGLAHWPLGALDCSLAGAKRVSMAIRVSSSCDSWYLSKLLGEEIAVGASP